MSSEAYTEFVDVNVGIQGETPGHGAATFKTFKLLKGVLSFYSGYFDSCVKGQFSEANRGAVDLPEEEGEIFENFVNWLYTRNGHFKFRPLINLWVLADRRHVPLLANMCLDGLRDRIVDTWKVPLNKVGYVYENTAKGSCLRRFIIYAIAHTCDPRL